MRDKFRKSSNSTVPTKLDVRNPVENDRSRGREKERNARGFRRSQSRSPNKNSRHGAPLLTSKGRDDNRSRLDSNIGKPRLDGDGQGRLDYDLSRKGKQPDNAGKLRMDNLARGGYDNLDRGKRYPDVGHRNRGSGVNDDGPSGIKRGSGNNMELDRVMKRAREERNTFWNKKVMEAEERDPQRWGHSGFKELYRRDMRHSRSVSPSKGALSKRHRSRSISPPKALLPKRHRSRSVSPPKTLLSKRHGQNMPFDRHHKRSRSRSRSPLLKAPSRSSGGLRTGRDISPLMSRRTAPQQTKPRLMQRQHSSPMSGGLSRDRKKENGLSARPRSGNNKVGSGSGIKSGTKPRGSGLSSHKPRLLHGATRISDIGKKALSRNSRSKSSSLSISSDSLGSSPYIAKSSRTSGSKNENALHAKSSRTQVGKRSHTRSVSRSSSSSTSSDDDVLQLHPKSKGKSRSLSYSDSSSSASDSSASVKLSTRNKTTTRSSSSSSSRSSSSDYDSDKDRKGSDKKAKSNVSANGKKPSVSTASATKSKPDVAKNKAAKNLGPSDIDSDSSRSGIQEVATVVKSKTTPTNSKTTPKKAPPSKTDVSKPSKGLLPLPKPSNKEKVVNSGPNKSGGAVSQSGESDSDSDSSSDSQDSEPKMTLSERFAKLTQMSTDKREYAKPVLSVNEIDTKLKVVKDLRNADTKVYVDGAPALPAATSTALAHPRRVRPKSPECVEGEKRYTSDERRRHFEKMVKDEPTDRPADWSDTRVRYYYYRDRGYFNDRPLTLEEYIKWEEWWYKYRDWLQNESYLNRMSSGGDQGHQAHFSGSGHAGGNWAHGGHMDNNSRQRPYNTMGSRRVERMPAPLLSNRPNFGRPESNSYLQNQIPIGRRIGRTPAGSLVVNIRQGNHYNPRDKRMTHNNNRTR